MSKLAVIGVVLGVLVATDLFLVAGGDSRADAIKKELVQLEGVWVVVSAENNGQKASAEQIKKDWSGRLVFEGGKASIRAEADLLVELTFKIDPTKKPKTLDLTVVTGKGDFKKGKKSLAIYELNGDTLKACYTHFAVERERPTEFATKPDSGLLLLIYKRAKK